MGKYKDHRDQRRHRHPDENGSFSGRTPEPSYFQRPSAAATDPVDAEVLWFNASKGFGFVKLADDSEVYLPKRALEVAGADDLSDGTRLKVRVDETPRGRQVSQVLEIRDAIPKAQSHRGPRNGAASEVPKLKGEGTVKWYNSEKGFGFIAPGNGGKDIFVHVTALTRSGLSGLAEGQKVLVECGQGKKCLEVHSIRLV